MATGTLMTLHNSITAGFSAEITASGGQAFDEICHSLGAVVRGKINTNEVTFVYIIVNNAPYYGFVTRTSSKVVIGFLYYPAITTGAFIKFRDSSDDAAATYTIYNS